MRRAAWLAIVLAVPAASAPAQKPFIDCTQEELVRAVPELAGIRFDSSQDSLDPLLRATGEKLRSMFAGLMDFSAAEDIHELRFDSEMAATSRHEAFRYGINMLRGGAGFQEVRTDPSTHRAVAPPASAEFLVLSYFYRLLNYLLPQYQDESRFRYLGRWNSGEQRLLVVAFGQNPDSTLESHLAIGPNGQTAKLQGLVWIDAASSEIVRLRVDLLGPVENFPFETATTDISYTAVTFPSIGRVLQLPNRVTAHATFAAGEFHSVQRYSDYEAGGTKGTEAAKTGGEDSYELLAKGITLLDGGAPAGAIVELREALARNPELPAAHFHLASALLGSNDLAGAEAELREAVKLAPESAVVHNLLGIVLGKRGDNAGAVAELRTSAQMLPKEPTIHYNLAQALERSGDPTAALTEYRTASELAPDNAAFKNRYEQLATAPSTPAPPETAIKVDVRQVLVPVIVTDKEGHYVTGLKQADFRVFEDDVEQKISAFSVEDSGLADSPGTVADAPARPLQEQSSPAPGKRATVRQTYLILIDSLHSAASNLMSFRQSLLQLFQTERSEDSQYLLVAMGTSIQLIQDTTSDRDKILAAIDSKEFLKVFNDSRKTQGNYDVEAFRAKLDRVRRACDQRPQPDLECFDKPSLQPQARQLASEDRVYNRTFLSLFQALVQQFTRAPGRRTMVLISDGFQLIPGKQAFDLLAAYFPDLRSMDAVDRMLELDPVLRIAANNNILIYTIDSRGLYTPPMFDASNRGVAGSVAPAVAGIMSASAQDAGDTLSEIAAATGATAFHNSNDLLTGLQRAFADGRQYYMLAYVPANATSDGKFRAISVRVRDDKMSVKAKRGYWAPTN